MSDALEGRKEAVKTYIEQTKLLVTLASAFVVAPAALIPLFKDSAIATGRSVMSLFLWAEACFVLSVLLGYVVLGTIAGYQHKGKYDVYRNETFYSSWIQIGAYLAGLMFFVLFMRRLFGS